MILADVTPLPGLLFKAAAARLKELRARQEDCQEQATTLWSHR